MAATLEFTKARLAKSYVIAALFTFLIPGFSLWFFDHVESSYDKEIRNSVVASIRADASLKAAERDKAIAFYERVPVSRILASNKPEAKPLQDSFAGVQLRYAIFRWMKRIALVCLGSGIIASVAVGIGVLLSFRSQSAQYWSLRLGWTVLRGFAVIEVVGQGVLAVALSFWVTAFWAESYYIKLILLAGVLALCAVGLLIKAIFRKLPVYSSFEGRMLTKDAAPYLWQRVTQMAEKLGIAPPDNIFVGIDDNFFVTEHPVKVGDKPYHGRTLFASLSLLKTLSRTEADAVLAHELAHFSGEDTIYSRRISPLLGKYVHYLEALYHGAISLPIFHFMLFFWNLYQLSLNKLRREREFRADRVGSEITSKQDMGQALVKIAAYCRYREKVQTDLFGKEENVEVMDVSVRIENGFPAFMKECVAGTELADSGTPHPFDTHPPLGKRVENLGLEMPALLQSQYSLPAPENSWFSAIEGAAGIEAEQWKAFEDAFHTAHQESLAWRFTPSGEAEIAHVLKYFPEAQFRTPKDLTVTIDYEKLRSSEWESPVMFSDIIKCRIDETLGRNKLVIDYKLDGDDKKRSAKIPIDDFKGANPSLLDVFNKYYSRHMTAKEYHAQKNVEAAPGVPQDPAAVSETKAA